MKPALLFFMIFSANTGFAQLHISPSKYGDSYFYVKDRLLFVEKDIALELNNNDKTEASIYLRKQGQLLQGSKSTNRNSGTGKLSAFQKGTSNAYDYNYWSLPVAVRAPLFALSDYIYEPISNTESRKAKVVASLDGSSNPLTISNQWIYAFSGSDYSSWQYIGDYFDLIPGEGFSMKGVHGSNPTMIEGEVINAGSSQVYDMRGMPNDGTIEIPIKKDQVILIGNPYPSTLNLDQFLTQNKATTGIAYFWDSSAGVNSHYLADYVGGYGTYSPGIGQYVPPMFKRINDDIATGETGLQIDRSISPIGQGFMVIGKSEGSIVFENSQRIYLNDKSKTAIFKNTEIERSFIRLTTEINNTHTKQLILAFDETSTINEDHAQDARKMENSDNDINWKINEEDYIINVRPKLDQELIPLQLNLKDDAQVEFHISEFQNFDPDRLFIYDQLQDLYFGIKNGSLQLNLPAGEYAGRFYVSFVEKLPIAEEKPETPILNQEFQKPPRVLLNSVEIFQNNLKNQLEVNILYETDLAGIRLYDLTGKLVFSQDFKTSEKQFIHPTVNFSNAIYIVRVKTQDNIEVTKKVAIKN